MVKEDEHQPPMSQIAAVSELDRGFARQTPGRRQSALG
jgi:hypothetical protein